MWPVIRARSLGNTFCSYQIDTSRPGYSERIPVAESSPSPLSGAYNCKPRGPVRSPDRVQLYLYLTLTKVYCIGHVYVRFDSVVRVNGSAGVRGVEWGLGLS